MHPVRIRLTVDLGQGDEAEFTTAPMMQRMADLPTEVALVQLDRAHADAKAWITARQEGDRRNPGGPVLPPQPYLYDPAVDGPIQQLNPKG